MRSSDSNKYIPEYYYEKRNKKFNFYYSDNVRQDFVNNIEKLIDELIDKIQNFCSIKLKREIQICMYDNKTNTKTIFGFKLPENMYMVPYSNINSSIIVFFSDLL